jgi:cytochrome c oxidase assembly protein subunit 15
MALATTVGAWTVMVLGGYVSSVGAGDACPDWPLCYGQIVPPFELPGVAVEYGHRLAAAVVGVLMLGLLLLAWTRHRARRRLVSLTTVATGLLVVQVGLGGLTVTSNLAPLVVAAHLGLATAYFGTIVLLTAMAYRQPAVAPAAPEEPALEAKAEPEAP